MTKEMMIEAIENIKAIEAYIKELESEADMYKDQLKAEMNDQALEQMKVGEYVVRYTSTSTARFNKNAFIDKMGEEMYRLFLTETLSRRFSIA